MSLGGSVRDALLLSQLAWRTIEGAKKSCGEHDELAREVMSLQKALQRVSDELANPNSPINRVEAKDRRWAELAGYVDSCGGILKVMDSVLTKYNALGDDKKGSKKLWQKIKFKNGEMKDLSEIRLKVSIHTTAITLGLNLFLLGSQGRVEKQLADQRGDLRGIRESVNWIYAKIATVSRERSTTTSHMNDDRSLWSGLRRELVREGYSSSTIRRHKSLLKDYLVELGERGILDDAIESALCQPENDAKETLLLEPLNGDGSISTGLEFSALNYEHGTSTDSGISNKCNTTNEPHSSTSYHKVQVEDIVDEEFAPGAHGNIEVSEDLMSGRLKKTGPAITSQNTSPKENGILGDGEPHLSKSIMNVTRSSVSLAANIQSPPGADITSEAQYIAQSTSTPTYRLFLDRNGGEMDEKLHPPLLGMELTNPWGLNQEIPEGRSHNFSDTVTREFEEHAAEIPVVLSTSSIWTRIARLEREIEEQRQLAEKHRIKEEEEEEKARDAAKGAPEYVTGMAKVEAKTDELEEMDAEIKMEDSSGDAGTQVECNELPIKFKDAIGRKYSLPFQEVRTWAVSHEAPIYGNNI